ncbi:hypothetical protein K435DRAFT_796875 [Dendrothele bispora CBS 962.96]|uniref:Uncharacterized protein n=1 Tax=Dendrothele bispora (strain CBS 962.96) TaxID=1314807 RepID=A0A4S8M5E8_DENBC|nr:hypothetical protein K435DRAFT_796875 [Dendrothele bispora CBS 962.96]
MPQPILVRAVINYAAMNRKLSAQGPSVRPAQEREVEEKARWVEKEASEKKLQEDSEKKKKQKANGRGEEAKSERKEGKKRVKELQVVQSRENRRRRPGKPSRMKVKSCKS